jgi:hypothetical protein
MILTIILAILTISIITTLIMMYLWWKKYGKELFKMIFNQNDLKLGNPFGETKNMFKELSKTMGMIEELNNKNSKNGK